MNTSTTRRECMDMALADLVNYYEDLCDESIRSKMEYEKGGK